MPLRSPKLPILVALLVLLVTPGCALVNLLVEMPTPTSPPQRALRPTFTPTATSLPPASSPMPEEALVQAEEPPLVPTEVPAVELELTPLEEATAMPEAPMPTPELPTPTPEPPPPTATPYVVVTEDGMPARSGPGLAYDAVGELSRDNGLSVVAKNDAADWWQVCCLQDQLVWVPGELVSAQGSVEGVPLAQNIPPSPTPTATPEPIPMVVVTNPSVNLRSGPGTDFSVVSQLQQGISLEVIGRNAASDWWQVCCVDGADGWVFGEVVRTEGPVQAVALAVDLPTATPEPTETPAAAAVAVSSTVALEPDPSQFAMELVEVTTFPFPGKDYFRVAAKVHDPDENPLGHYYLRIFNETTGQAWLSSQSGNNAWTYTAPSSDFADFREANIQFDTSGKAVLADNSYVIWLVDGANRQVSQQVRHAGDGDFQWVYVVFALK